MAVGLASYRDYPWAEGSVVCLGNFDGVHRGHARIMERALMVAGDQKLHSLVMSFRPHPMKVLRPHVSPPLLFNDEEKKDFLMRLPFDAVLIQEFTHEFASITAEAFCEDILVKALRARFVVVGTNYRFGHQAQGNLTFLKTRREFETMSVGLLEEEHEAISSSWIRKLIQDGQVSRAAELLGHPYFITGQVVKGAGQGAPMGFPTANIRFSKDCLPRCGSYVTIAEDLETGHFYPSVSNLGRRPTFYEADDIHLETHFISFNDELGGRRLRVHFMHFIRGELKFDGLVQLQAAIRADMQEGQRFFEQANYLRGDKPFETFSLENNPKAFEAFQPYKIIHI